MRSLTSNLDSVCYWEVNQKDAINAGFLQLASSDFISPVGVGGFQDSNVPYPRTSGARFCGTGQLVCFGWSYTVKVTLFC